MYAWPIIREGKHAQAEKMLKEQQRIFDYISRTFYRAFKNKYNLTPTEYRKLSRKKEG